MIIISNKNIDNQNNRFVLLCILYLTSRNCVVSYAVSSFLPIKKGLDVKRPLDSTAKGTRVDRHGQTHSQSTSCTRTIQNYGHGTDTN